MAKSKNINLYLMDGNAKGKIKVQISNWNGIAYKIPRELLLECKDLDAFSKSGVYFLFGNKNVYIGKAEVRKNGKAIHQRIIEHESDKLKDKWNEVVIFTTKDKSWGLTEISFLENKFYNKVSMAGRYSTVNDQEPSMSTVTEEKESELEEFMDQAELILSLLGHQVFEPITDLEKPAQDIKPKTISEIKIPGLPVKKKDTIVCSMSQETFKKFEANGRGKDKIVKKLFDEWGIDYDQNVNFAKFMSRRKYYWMEPSGDVLSKDWTIALFNTDTLIITVIRVPKDSLSVSKDGLKVRNDSSKQGYLDLVFLDNSFIEKQSKVDFSKYITNVIKVEL